MKRLTKRKQSDDIAGAAAFNGRQVKIGGKRAPHDALQFIGEAADKSLRFIQPSAPDIVLRGRGMIYRECRATRQSAARMTVLAPVAGTIPGQSSGKSLQRLSCRDIRTGELLVFRGELLDHPHVSRGASHAKPMAQQPTRRRQSSPVVSNPADMQPAGQPCARRQRTARSEELAEKLIAVVKAAERGMDSDLKIDEVMFCVNESRPTIYRKMKSGHFPQRIKRGRSSFWKASQVLAYRDGRWKPDTA